MRAATCLAATAEWSGTKYFFELKIIKKDTRRRGIRRRESRPATSVGAVADGDQKNRFKFSWKMIKKSSLFESETDENQSGVFNHAYRRSMCAWPMPFPIHKVSFIRLGKKICLKSRGNQSF